MTDAERTSFFESKSKAIINELVGDVEYSPVDNTFRMVDKNWYKNKSFHDIPRILNPMNADTKGVREYQEQLRENGGYVYSTVEPTIGTETPVVK